MVEIDENKWISEYHGMELQPVAEVNKRHNENGILFYSHFLTLKNILGELTYSDVAKFQVIVENIRSYDKNGQKIKGLFDRGAGESLRENKESVRSISHDNITAIACFSFVNKKEGLKYHKEIAKYGRENKWRFDNVHPENPRLKRTMHPRDIVFWSYLDGKLWAKLFIIYPIIEMIFTCYKNKDIRPRMDRYIIDLFKGKGFQKRESIGIPTSGKCLSFIRLYAIRESFMGKIAWKICSRFVKRSFLDGWRGVFNYYFQNKDHPINLKINEQYKKNKRIF